MIDILIYVVFALVFSSIFSGMELAFTTFNRFRFEIGDKQDRFIDRVIDYFFVNSERYIATILICKYVLMLLYSFWMLDLLAFYADKYMWGVLGDSMLLNILVLGLIYVLFAEFLAKLFVRINPSYYLKIFALPILLTYFVLYPITYLSLIISRFLLWIFGFKGSADLALRRFDRDDLEELLEEVAESDATEEQEQDIKLFQNAIDFSELRVRDFMIQRIDMVALDVNTSIKELLTRFIETQYSRIFIFEDSIDNIIGYVNTKDLFTNSGSIQDILREVDFVPESMPAQKLLTNLIRSKGSVAIVVDEFGGTAGLVSMEDVLEEIFGEIEDEYDSNDSVEIVLSGNEYIFSCRLEVEYLNEKYGFSIPKSDEYDTLAGYIILHNEGIPSQGVEVNIGNSVVKILRKSSSRLDLVRYKIIDLEE